MDLDNQGRHSRLTVLRRYLLTLITTGKYVSFRTWVARGRRHPLSRRDHGEDMVTRKQIHDLFFK